MLIYFNGDSNTEGTELDNPSEQGFAGKLAKKFNAQHINQAFAGASNDKIFRTTEEYLQECKTKNQFPDLIIIGWTEWIREDWFINGEYHSLNSFGLRNPETVDQARFKQWEEYQAYNLQFSYHLSKYFSTRIHNLHLELEHLNIPHLFFSATRPFSWNEELFREDPRYGPVYQLEWNNCYFRPYDPRGTMIFWAEDNNYKEITPGWNHYNESAQEGWANLLHKHINEYKII